MGGRVMSLEQATQWLTAQSLPPPPIPAEFESALVAVTENLYGTRTDKSGLYAIADFTTEVASQATADYLLFGLGGRGMASNAFHYYLVRGPLALFVQLAYGNVYENKPLSLKRIASAWQQAETLIQAMAEKQTHFAPDERLLIMMSSFTGASWTQFQGLQEAATFGLAANWHQSDAVLEEVLAYVSSLA